MRRLISSLYRLPAKAKVSLGTRLGEGSLGELVEFVGVRKALRHKKPCAASVMRYLDRFLDLMMWCTYRLAYVCTVMHIVSYTAKLPARITFCFPLDLAGPSQMYTASTATAPHAPVATIVHLILGHSQLHYLAIATTRSNYCWIHTIMLGNTWKELEWGSS